MAFAARLGPLTGELVEAITSTSAKVWDGSIYSSSKLTILGNEADFGVLYRKTLGNLTHNVNPLFAALDFIHTFVRTSSKLDIN